MLSHLQYSVHPHKRSSPDPDSYPSGSSQFYPQDTAFTPSYHANGASDSDPQQQPHYVSQSPSPVDAHPPASALPHPITATPSQERFLHSDVTPFSAEDRIPTQTEPGSEREALEPSFDKYSPGNVNSSLLDQRRMSEPAALSIPSLYPSSQGIASRYQSLDVPYSGSSLHQSKSFLTPLQRGISTGSLRDLRHHHIQYPPHPSEWKHNSSLPEHSDLYDQQGADIDEPVSPMQPNFTGGLVGSPTLGVPYSPLSDSFYGPSPPGTGTSTSSSAPLSAGIANGSPHSSQHFHRSMSSSNVAGDAADRKTYSFVALPGNAVKKRPRRRYDEIERLYQCSWPDCSKAYGTLNHLNAHVTMQKHGPKRSPAEFKDLRKQWRKAKKESEAAAVAMRRQSFEAYDDHSGFDHRYMSSQSMHQRQHNVHHGMGLPSSVSVAQPGTAERFPVAIDDIRFPSYDRSDTLSNFTSYPARQRYSGSLPASWQDGPNISSRQSYMPSSSLPSHHSQLPQLNINNRLSHSTSIPESFNRLPQNSTLLTPLPGYHAEVPSMINAILPGDSASYGNTEAFDAHDTDSNGRPGTGHASIGHHSGDEYHH